MERDIEKAEAAVARLDAAINENASDYQKLLELSSQKESAEAALEALYETWEALSEEG